jgi:hypothetical protein
MVEGGTPKMSETEDLRQELEKVKAENQRLKQQERGGLRLKISEKGALSVYGLGRFPVTLYKEQWQRLLAQADALREFLEQHAGELKSKGEAR